MSEISTVIFDMYETLAENNPDLWQDTFDRICRDQKLSITAGDLWRHWKAVEMNFRKERLKLEEPEKSPPFKSYEEAWRNCFQDVFERLGLPGDAAAAARVSVEDMGLRKAYPETVDALNELRTHWKLAVLSNSDEDYLRPTLARLGVPFQATLSSEAARAYKPHPAIFRQMTEMLGVTPGECVYVGDSQFDDVLGAQRSGMKTAWVNRKGALLDPNLPVPDYQVGNLTELPQALLR